MRCERGLLGSVLGSTGGSLAAPENAASVRLVFVRGVASPRIVRNDARTAGQSRGGLIDWHSDGLTIISVVFALTTTLQSARGCALLFARGDFSHKGCC